MRNLPATSTSPSDWIALFVVLAAAYFFTFLSSFGGVAVAEDRFRSSLNFEQREYAGKQSAEAVREFAHGSTEVLCSKPSSDLLVLAHYMPWYVAKPSSDHWGWHWTMDHFDPETQTNGRREIASKFYPLIGPYDSGDVDVLEYHLLTMKLAGIEGVIVDWYGLTDFRDYATLNRNTYRLLQQCERLKMKFVICYEDQTIPALVEGNRIKASERVSHATSEINWLGKYWFKSPSYVRLDDKPVMLSFGHSGLTNEDWGQCLKQLEVPISYFSQGFQRAGAVGGFGWPAPNQGLKHTEQFHIEAEQWANNIPVVFPRFVDIYRDAKVGDGYPELPDNEGTTFRNTLAWAIEAKPQMIQLATWNDWGEGTQIEPSKDFGFRDLEFLQQQRREHSAEHSDLNPSDLQLGLRLLQRRRSKQFDASKLDGVADLIANGHPNDARLALDRLENVR